MWVTDRKASYPTQVHTVATVTAALLHFYPSLRRDGNRLTAGADAPLTASNLTLTSMAFDGEVTGPELGLDLSQDLPPVRKAGLAHLCGGQLLQGIGH